MTEILFGKNPVLETLKAGRRKVHEVFLEGNRQNPKDPPLYRQILINKYKIELVDGGKMEALTGSFHHQGIAAKVDGFPYSDLKDILSSAPANSLFMMCDSIQDPQNMGALCRSALCFGVSVIILNRDRSVSITPSVVKASAGAVEYLSITQVTNLSRTLGLLKKEGFWSYAADPKGPQKLSSLSFSPKTVVVMGSEKEGIRPLILKECDFRFCIPMTGKFDSLNVSQAASIILYEISKSYNS